MQNIHHNQRHANRKLTDVNRALHHDCLHSDLCHHTSLMGEDTG